jgi:hypothetical protein
MRVKHVLEPIIGMPYDLMREVKKMIDKPYARE